MPLNIQEFSDFHFELSRFSDGKKADYNPEDLHELCIWAIEIISAEPPLVEMPAPCAIVGDLHGYFYDLLLLFKSFMSGEYHPGARIQRFMFLGNYVDYGSRSVEVLSLLLSLKIRFPDRYQLLRGNHEDALINRAGGFFDELVGRFGADEGEKLFNHFNEVFSRMPLAGVIGKKIFCVHGGLSPHLRSLEDIEKIPRPLTDPMSHPLAANLLWSEPDEKATSFRIHPKRDFAVLFGEDNVVKFLEDTDMSMVVKGGDVTLRSGSTYITKKTGKEISNGFWMFANQKLLSIFGAARFMDNNAATSLCVSITGAVQINIFMPVENRE